MPDRIYISIHEPPTVWDRFWAHAFQVTFTALSGLLGIAIIAGSLHPDWVPSKSIDQMPNLVAFVIGVFVFTGAALVIAGALWPGKLSGKLQLDRAGWILYGTGWGCYSIAVIYSYPESVISWGAHLAMALAAAAGFFVSILVERQVRRRTGGPG